MLVSLNWLSRYVDLSDKSPEEISGDLTLTTAEVERIVPFGESLEAFVVGYVAERSKHPEADKLSCCKVDDGTGELKSVVCGAPNVDAGQKIVFIRSGSRMPDGTKIKKSKLRGQVSQGMICSERELGLSDEHEGILVLDTEAAPGTPLLDVLPLRDTLFEIDNKSITHRPDLWGHYGFARELAAIYGRELRPALADDCVSIPESGVEVPIRLPAKSSDCPRYVGLVLDGVKVGPSPAWMRQLLIAVGQRPINNVVDLTNFILFDLGQPMHAFDHEGLAGPEIVVRLAEEGEKIRTLDGQDRELSSEDLLICDGERPVALAGVMGGEGTMVSAGTTRLFLESANFDPVRTRRTSVRTALRSESSARFEKSLDPSLAELAARKFAHLLAELCPGAKPAGPLSDPAAWRYESLRVPLKLSKARRVLGFEITTDEVHELLTPLGFTLDEDGEEDGLPRYLVSIPSFRATKDISIEEDLIEELGRRYRYDNIEERVPMLPVRAPYKDEELYALRRVKEVLAGDCGYFEAYNYSFLSDDLVERLGIEDLPYTRVTNSIASHLSRMRRDVLPSLLGSLAVNLRHRERVAIFEAGKGYRPERPGLQRIVDGELQGTIPEEKLQVAGIFASREDSGCEPLAELRGALQHVLERMGRGSLAVSVQSDPLSWMHPARTACLHPADDEGRVVAYLGEVHPEIVTRLGLEYPKDRAIAAFSLDLRELLATPEDAPRYRPVPKFPEQPIDLAFLAPESVMVRDVEAALRSANPKLVREVEVFEIYRGKGVPEGQKSLNFRVRLGSEKKTLAAKDEEKFIQRARQVTEALGVQLRG